MTYHEAADKIGATAICYGGCGLSDNRHQTGTIDPFGVAHWSERRVTRRGLRRLLLMLARRDRLVSPNYLNEPHLAWYHLHSDEQYANMLAGMIGVRFPAAFSRTERLQTLTAARRSKVALSSRYPAIYSWATRGLG